MSKKFIKALSLFLLAFTVFSVFLTGTYELIIPDSVDCLSGSTVPSYPLVSTKDTNLEFTPVYSDIKSGNVKANVDYKLYGIFPLKSVSVTKNDLYLYPGGMPFGVKFLTDGIMVIGFSDVDGKSGKANPSYRAGIRENDIITKANGNLLCGASEFTKIVESCNGKPISLTFKRNGKEQNVSITPIFSVSEKKYKSGLFIRDSGAGIGTVTFIVPKTYAFAGLGHGICDGGTGSLIPMQRGSVIDVTINGVVKGLCGSPGEVRGFFDSGKSGSLLLNTDCGVYGIFADKPKKIHCEPLPVGKREEVREGKAFIYSTLDSGGVGKYGIEIQNIDRSAKGNKCFTVKITDSSLIEKTGGIIQGMSGSPIIQDGKIVGAVTHVLINDPTTGYGIFIDNMLNIMP